MQFYINYEECKSVIAQDSKNKILRFILTMRNVNYSYQIRKDECLDCFILTMRNVNEKLRGDVCVIDVGFILTMRNVNLSLNALAGVNLTVLY